MRTLVDHEFLKRKDGELALLLNVLSFEEALDPVLLVSGTKETAYLRRSKDDIYEIVGIQPGVIEDVRKAQSIVVLELLGDQVKHSYAVPTDILESEDN